MTCLVAWVGRDANRDCSIYIASDSRFTWAPSTGSQIWDFGPKTFISNSTPIIIGYCGDVLFPISVLQSAISQIDQLKPDPDLAIAHIEQRLKDCWPTFPYRNSCKVIIGSKTGEKSKSLYRLDEIVLCPQSGISRNRLWPTTEAASELMISWNGSGGPRAKSIYESIVKKSGFTASRLVFQAVAKCIITGADRLTGGNPQLVGIRDKDISAQHYLIANKGEVFLQCQPIDPAHLLCDHPCFNLLFENCDPVTKARRAEAKVHENHVFD